MLKPHALRIKADTEAATADTETAEAGYRSGIRLAEELGMRPLVAHGHLGLGKLYRRTNKRDQARQHLSTAPAMYSEMVMTHWLEKAEMEVKEAFD